MAKFIAAYYDYDLRMPVKRYAARVAVGARKPKTALVPGGMRNPFGSAGENHAQQLARQVAKAYES